MGLIKSSNVPANTAPFSMRDIETQARAMLLRAQQQADQLLATAQVEGVKLRQAAYDEGFAAGKQDGTRKGAEEGRAAGTQAALAEHRAKLEQLSKSLITAATEIDASRSMLESTAGTEVVKLAVAIARRVTKLASLDPTVLTQNITEALKLVVHSTDIRIVLHPSQKQVLLEVLPRLKLAWPNISHVEIIEDASIAPGGCRLCTAHGEIDADLDRQVDRIAADLLPNQPQESVPA